MTEPVAARMLLICADTSPQRRWLVDEAMAGWRQCDAEQSTPVIDLCEAGDLWAGHIWQQLIPVLLPWWQLLDGEAVLPEPPGRLEIPGLDTVLSCLYLADQCFGLQTDLSLDTLVILPPLEQALPILQLACRGPDLLEELWRPLLHWWAQTRQRLGQFELVLRMRLPSAESLELSERWRACLTRLAQRLNPATAAAEVWLAVAAEAADLDRLGARVAALPLCGLPRLRLWLDADLPGAEIDQLRQQLAMPLLAGRCKRNELDTQAWLCQPLPDQTLLWQGPEGGWSCRLYLPGLQREGLQVRQIEQALQIRSSGLRLVVPMPAAWPQLTCRSARIDSPWLAIEFG